MRVAYVCADPGIPYGGTKGASVHMGEITRALAAGGAEVLVLAAVLAQSAGSSPGVTAELLPHLGRGVGAQQRVGVQGDVERHLVARLTDWGADVVYERFALHAVAGSRAARELGLPHLVELNAPLLWEAETFRRLDAAPAATAMEREVLSRAAAVLPVTRPLERHARERGARQTTIVPNAATVRDAPDAATRAPRAVFAGTLRPWHGVEAIVGAWQRMGDAAPELLIVGDGPGRDRIEEVGGRVLGMVPPGEVAGLLSGSLVGLAPFSHDAPEYFSPIKLFEYMAAGLAVVAGRLPGVLDVVEPGTAVLIPPGDADALAAAVSALAAEPERAASMGQAARRLVEDAHTWRHRATCVLEVARATVPAP